jgi:hypothetical protein
MQVNKIESELVTIKKEMQITGEYAFVIELKLNLIERHLDRRVDAVCNKVLADLKRLTTDCAKLKAEIESFKENGIVNFF